VDYSLYHKHKHILYTISVIDPVKDAQWGLLELQEWTWICETVSKPPWGDTLVIGCGNGHGAIEAVLRGQPYGFLWCVDNWAERPENCALFGSFVANHSQHDRVKFYEMDSDTFFRSVLDPEHKFAFVFVDGDHAYSQALRDFANAWEHILPGGVVAGHDFFLESVQKAGKETGVMRDAPHSIRYGRCPR